MQQWIYVLKPTRLGMVTEGSTPEEDEIVGQHFAYLKDLTEKGVMIMLGRTQNNDEIHLWDRNLRSGRRRVGTSNHGE